MQPIDLRSDTVTRPTAAMKQAMVTAELGDDVFGDDPTVAALEERAAGLLGKEAALYVPSGTMANQLALRVHTQPGDEVIAHARCHIHNYESGAPAALWGVTVRAVDSADGSLPEEQVLAALHTDSDPHLAPTRLVCFENTHNACGGTVVPQEAIERVARLARGNGLGVHLDGARLLNAAVASGRTAADLARSADTVSLCLSKGLGAPVGSVLAGPLALIRRARRFRKMLGGGMRQAGIIAAAGLWALEHNVSRLADDHRRARHLAEALAAMPGVSIDLPRVQTNIVYFGVDPTHPLAAHLGARLAEAGVLVTGHGLRYRAVLHLQVDDAQTERAIATLRGLLS